MRTLVLFLITIGNATTWVFESSLYYWISHLRCGWYRTVIIIIIVADKIILRHL